jgi:hypothetical protein
MMAEPSGSVSSVGYHRRVVMYMLGSSTHWQSSLSSHGSRNLRAQQSGKSAGRNDSRRARER